MNNPYNFDITRNVNINTQICVAKIDATIKCGTSYNSEVPELYLGYKDDRFATGSLISFDSHPTNIMELTKHFEICFIGNSIDIKNLHSFTLAEFSSRYDGRRCRLYINNEYVFSSEMGIDRYNIYYNQFPEVVKKIAQHFIVNQVVNIKFFIF